MYKYIELASEPSNKNAKLWRYMDITKFLFLLETSSLYFTRGDMFKDSFEGSLPKPTREFLSKTIPDMMKVEGIEDEAIQSRTKDLSFSKMASGGGVGGQW